MSERTAKAKRRAQTGPPKPKQFFKPYMVPMPTGETDPVTGKRELKDTYITRKVRRKMMRYLMTSLRKGRIDPRKLQEAEDRT